MKKYLRTRLSFDIFATSNEVRISRKVRDLLNSSSSLFYIYRRYVLLTNGFIWNIQIEQEQQMGKRVAKLHSPSTILIFYLLSLSLFRFLIVFVNVPLCLL